VLTALAVAGCDRAATTETASGVVSLRVRDYRYDRQTVRVPAGPTTFRLANDGTEPTNFRIRRAGRERDLTSITTLEPGTAGTTTVKLRPGEYVMHSSVGRHEVLGEYGRLIVTRR
jgi:hypothetical protein